MASKNQFDNHRNWKFLGLGTLIFILLLSAYLLLVFLDVLILSIAIAYIVYPIAKWINKGKTGHNIRYLSSSMAAVLLVAIPVIFVLFYGLNIVLQWFVQNLPAITSGNFLAEIKTGLDSIGLSIVSERIASEIGKLLVGFTNSLSSLIIQPAWLVKTFVKVALFFVATFYFVYEGPEIQKLVDEQIPKRERFLREMFDSVNKILYSLFVSHLFTSIIIGAIAWFGFWIILRPSMLMLAFLTALMFIISFLPVIGPWLMYVPMGIWEIIFIPDGFWKGIVLIVFGLIFLTFIPDFYIRPKLVKRGAQIHPLLLILGFFGGPMLMGLKGVIIGPLILGLAQAIVTIYIEKRAILKELVEHF